MRLPILAIALILSATPALAARSTDFLQRGRAEYAAGHYEVAVKSLEKAIVANPMNVEAYSTLAKVHQAAGRPNQAAKYFGIALEIDPINRGALEGDGLLALKYGLRDRAEARLTRLQGFCSDCAETKHLALALEQAK